MATAANYFMFPNTGTVVDYRLAVYLDGAPITSGTEIDWGKLTAGNTYQHDNLTVVNIGTETLNVFIHTINLPQYLQLGWSQNNTVLAAGQKTVDDIPLTLTVNAAAPLGPFSFDLYVNGEEA